MTTKLKIFLAFMCFCVCVQFFIISKNQSDIKQLTSDIYTLQIDLDSKNQKIYSQNQEIEQLNYKLADLQKQHEDLYYKYQGLNSRLNQAENTIAVNVQGIMSLFEILNH